MAALARMFGGLFAGKQAGSIESALPDGERIYAIGDVHGRLDLLRQLARQIRDDLAAFPVENSTEIFLGDYVDRGPDSSGVVDWLICQPPACQERICLQGNHEDTLLAFRQEAETLLHWQNYGGLETLRSYGLRVPLRAEPHHVAGLREEFVEVFPDAHLDFMSALRLCHDGGRYFFAHAGVRPGIAFERQKPVDLMWIRDDFLNYNKPLGKIVVHGHTPVDAPELLANRINIDTGAFITGKLSCAILEGDGVRILQT